MQQLLRYFFALISRIHFLSANNTTELGNCNSVNVNTSQRTSCQWARRSKITSKCWKWASYVTEKCASLRQSAQKCTAIEHGKSMNQKYCHKACNTSKKVCNTYGNTEMHFYNKYCNNCNISSGWVIERHPASENPRMPFTNKRSLLKQAMEENCEETNKPSSSIKWTLEQTVPRNDWISNTPTHTPI